VPPLPDPVVAAEALALRYPGAARDAFHGVALALAAGRSLAVLGPSGSGKSSLALALVGALPKLAPAAVTGRVRLCGASMEELSIADVSRHAALILQDSDAQIVALTVADEIAFGLECAGLEAAEIEARLAAALAVPPAAGLAGGDRTLALSGGWRQRLAVAATLALKTPLVIADEPAAHVENGAAAATLAALAARRRSGGATLIVEHDAERVAPLVDEILVLDAAGAPLIQAAPALALAEAARRAPALGLRLPAATRAAAALVRAGQLAYDAAVLDRATLRNTLGPRAADPALAKLVRAALGFDGAPAPAACGPALLTIEAASARLGGRRIVHDFDLAIGAGEAVGITGPNGAGKTTLALLAAGALRPAAGRVARQAPASPIYVPQNPGLGFFADTVGNEARRRGVPVASLTPWLERCGLPRDLARHPLAFSHGERRRLSLALALAAPGQRLVVLDEPGSGLDGNGIAAIGEAVAELKRRGAGVLIVSHDLDLLAAVADRLAVMAAGRVVASGATHEVLARILDGALPGRPTPAMQLAREFGWGRAPALAAAE
jgi:energy-coupling factor transport system ATP-binding protein